MTEQIDFSTLNEEKFVEVKYWNDFWRKEISFSVPLKILQKVFSEFFSRKSSTSETKNDEKLIQDELKKMIERTNPSDLQSADLSFLPKNLRKVYSNFVADFRRDFERFHLERAAQNFDQNRLKDFDWNVRVKKNWKRKTLKKKQNKSFQLVLHDEHLFKCRLPLLNLELQLTNEQRTQNVLLELDEHELDRLIEQMSNIEQVFFFNSSFFLSIFSELHFCSLENQRHAKFSLKNLLQLVRWTIFFFVQ